MFTIPPTSHTSKDAPTDPEAFKMAVGEIKTDECPVRTITWILDFMGLCGFNFWTFLGILIIYGSVVYISTILS
jgi:hypothetical protein